MCRIVGARSYIRRMKESAIMAKSHYKGKVKRYGETYHLTSAVRCTNSDGDTYCKGCGHSGFIRYVGEHIQYGFSSNKYMEFNECEKCGYRFCIVMLRTEDDYRGV